MELDSVLAHALECGGSDIHLKVSGPPRARVNGALVALAGADLTEEDLEGILARVTEATPRKREHFEVTGELDTSYVADGVGRFRVNGFRQRGSISFALRHVPSNVPTLESLGLPPGVQKLADERLGLVLVTGATGSGKSTTLAAMIDRINRSREQHIVTIEDPIEIVHDDRRCIVNQREVGVDTESYLGALRRVLRQDPDVILIGELRDEESAQAALHAAESGHFVLSTMHTIDASETVGRLIEFFPVAKQAVVRQVVASVLRGVVSQRLLPRVGGGRVAAVEVMVNTARIADLIRDPMKTDGITDAIEEGSFHQMQSFSQHLVELVLAEVADIETASSAATVRHDFELELERALRRKRVAETGTGLAVEVGDIGLGANGPGGSGDLFGYGP
ncbi:MAG: PilT/PilU family type 4a pilus ATPase [Thermoleophilia bacterium]|nr:PilT/PilU family type 4a pilus ATPase [Thermoleophilia bacterium]